MRPADIAAENRRQRPHAHTHHAIEHLHAAIAHEPNAQHKAKLTGALKQLMDIQAEMAAPPKVGAGA